MALATMNNAQFQSILDSYQLHCEISSLRPQFPLDLCKYSSDFLRSTEKFVQSSSCFWHLLSKCQCQESKGNKTLSIFFLSWLTNFVPCKYFQTWNSINHQTRFSYLLCITFSKWIANRAAVTIAENVYLIWYSNTSLFGCERPLTFIVIFFYLILDVCSICWCWIYPEIFSELQDVDN